MRHVLSFRAFTSVMCLSVLSACVTAGPLPRVTSRTPSYPAAPSQQPYDRYNDGYDAVEPAPSVITSSRGTDKNTIASCKNQALACVFDLGGIALGEPRAASGGLTRRAFKAPMHVPGKHSIVASRGTVSFGGSGAQDAPSRIFTVYYNDNTGMISRIDF